MDTPLWHRPPKPGRYHASDLTTSGRSRHVAASLLLALVIAVFGPLARDVHALPGPTPSATAKIDLALQGVMASDPLKLWPIIVEMRPASAPPLFAPNQRLALQALSLISQYGRPIGALSLIDAAAGAANAAGITAISQNTEVAFVYADATVRPTVTTDQTGVGLASAYPLAVNAVPLWQRGTTGISSAAVAVLDSGVNLDVDLATPNQRVLMAVNFAGDMGGMADAGGHGTHVAGTIAGNGGRGNRAYVGIAPAASIIDVRVLNSTGTGRISSVVRGIEWVLAHRSTYNIRLINLSLGMPARAPCRVDPLCAAVEIAWLHGLAVVAAVGNEGPQAGTLDSPGIDPYVITVGATDDQGTATVADDVLSNFSSWGTPPGSTAKPDVVAPGRRITSLRVAGSFLDRLLTGHAVAAPNGATYFRMSGTSMATAVVSGTAALLLQNHPNWTPDQLKVALATTTQRFGWAASSPAPPAASAGNGLIDALTAASASPATPGARNYRPADAAVSALYPVLYGSKLVWKDPSLGGIDWTSLTWDNLAWDNLAWDNLAWDNLAWDNLAWDNLAWDNLAWDNLAWDSVTSDNLAWDESALD